MSLRFFVGRLALALLSAGALGCTHHAGQFESTLPRVLEREELLRVVQEYKGVARAFVVASGTGKPIIVRYETEKIHTGPLSDPKFSGRFSGILAQHADPPRIVFVAQVKTATPFPPAAGWLLESLMYAAGIATRCNRAADGPANAPPPHNPPIQRASTTPAAP